LCSQTFTFLIVYRPPSSSLATFINEFSSILVDLSLSSELFISGDFNIHVDNPSGPHVSSFLSIIDSFSLIQHVDFPTHISGHTLDLLLSKSTSSVVSSVSRSDPFLSDHSAVSATLTLPQKIRSPLISKTVRCLKSVNISSLCDDILASSLYSSPATSLSDYFLQFKGVLSDLLDKHAPSRKIICSSKPQPVFITPEIRNAKKERSKLESIYRKNKTTQNYLNFKHQSKIVSKMITSSRRQHFRTLISSNKHKPSKLWTAVNDLLNKTRVSPLPSSTSTSDLASSFINFFGDKIVRLTSTISSEVSAAQTDVLPPVTPPTLDHFAPLTCQEVRSIIMSSSNSTCALDFFPTILLKQCIDPLLQPITTLLNFCITESTFPSDFKHALVRPLLKKHALPKDDLSSYRPISNLAFLSKILERALHKRLSTHLSSFSSISPFQSAYRKFHSVETTLLKIQNDLLLSLDKKKVSALVLLDLSAAFDTVDHSLLLSRLSSYFGISGTALSILSSYLASRAQSVVIGTETSVPSVVSCGVPQGSVLGPLLFTLYTTPLSSLLSQSHVSFHFYADDTQLYISFSSYDSSQYLSTLSRALEHVHGWLTSNKLFLNPDKTELLLIGSRHSRSLLTSTSFTFSNSTISASANVRNLGVVFDSNLSLSNQISSVCKSCRFAISQLRRVRQSLDLSTSIVLANALVTSRLDFCNSLYAGLPDSSIHRLQLVQNSLARVILPTIHRRQHITPLLKRLHWLPVPQRILFKTATMTFKSLHAQSPSYLSDLITPYQPSRTLRSASKHLLTVPTVTSAAGRRSFSYFGPTLWNSLPLHLRSCNSLSVFRSKLKTYLFPP